MRAINVSMRSQGVVPSLQRRVRRFFEFKWISMHGDDDTATSYISELPNGIRVDLMISLYSGIISVSHSPSRESSRDRTAEKHVQCGVLVA